MNVSASSRAKVKPPAIDELTSELQVNVVVDEFEGLRRREGKEKRQASQCLVSPDAQTLMSCDQGRVAGADFNLHLRHFLFRNPPRRVTNRPNGWYIMACFLSTGNKDALSTSLQCYQLRKVP